MDLRSARFHVAGMDCPTEEQLVRSKLEGLRGVTSLKFRLMDREVIIEHEAAARAAVDAAMTGLGLGARRIDEGERAEPHPRAEASSRWPTILLALSGASALAAEAVAWTTGRESSAPVIGLAVLSILAAGRETVRKGVLAVRTFTLNINFLMTIAVAGAVAIGQWPEAAMVTFLFALAELIEVRSLDRARNAIRTLMQLAPETASVLRGQAWTEVPAAAVEIGARVRVRPGERVPLDGRVVAGRSSINQAPITGESMPVSKTVGDAVYAGTINELGAIEIETTASAGDTTLARIIRTVQDAQGQRAPTQRFVDRFAKYYTPAVVLLAVAVAAIPPLALDAPASAWLYRALVLLVIACPCALVISTPVTVVSGLAAAARQGILVKGGVYLEAARKLRVLALDKTGTVTHGKPEVTDASPFGGATAQELIALAAAVDGPSEHPVARAIVARAQRDGFVVRAVEHFESITGRGARAMVDGRLVHVGSHRLAEEVGDCGTDIEAELKRLESEGKTTVVVVRDRTAIGVLAVADTARATSIEAIRTLHALGVRTVMLSGDNNTTARAIATRVGIDDARGGLMPDDKVAAIDDLRARHGAVGMVGDGINDAPALARADIGFAMGAAGTDTALETADVALMDDDLRKVATFLELSRRTRAILVQNITLAIGLKVVFFALGIVGVATLWMAVFADMGASLVVVANGLRLLRGTGSPASRPPANEH